MVLSLEVVMENFILEPENQQEKFIKLLTESQNRLYGYIFSLVGDPNRSKDILQEANLVLWRKIDEFSEIKKVTRPNIVISDPHEA